MVERWQSHQFEASDGSLTYHRTGGDKPPLILLHGFTDNGLCWSRVARAFAPDFDVIMLDGRGHGASSLPHSGVINPTQDLTELVEGLALQKPAVVGHSIGAMAALQFAAEQTGLLSKLVLEDPPLRNLDGFTSAKSASAVNEQVKAFKQMQIDDILQLGRTQHPQWSDEDYPEWAAAKQQVEPSVIETFRFKPWRQLLQQLNVPTLVITGAAGSDSAITPAKAAEAASLNANVRCISITGAGHNVRRENFDAYVSEVGAFLGAPPMA